MTDEAVLAIRACGMNGLESGTSTRHYRIGPWNAWLVEQIEWSGVIEYRFMMPFVLKNGNEAELIVTSESSPGFPAQFLGVFGAQGRTNLGSSDDWRDADTFVRRAISIAREELAMDPDWGVERVD